MQKLFWIAGFAATMNANAQLITAQGTDTARANTDMSQATVYFGYGAELTHQSKVKVNTSSKSIIIDRISTSVTINGLQISCPESVALLVRFSYSVKYPKDKKIINLK